MRKIGLHLYTIALFGSLSATNFVHAAAGVNYVELLNAPLSGPQDAKVATGASMSAADLARFGESTRSAVADEVDLIHFSKALNALPKAGRPTLRGAREVAIYAQVSPSVVLILNGDTLGSGTLIDTNGLIVTNWHVVGASKTVGIIFKPATEGAELTKSQVIRGRVVRIDQVADLALVQTQGVPPQATPARLATTSKVQIGDDVHAIGHPTGEAWTYTRGIVSQIRLNYQWSTEEKLQHHADVIQTQTPINPGNSGGPLLDDAGDVVGVNSFKGQGEGLNFAVATDAIQTLLGAYSDRLAPGIKEVARTTESGCKPKEIERWRTTDPAGLAISYDADCSGRADLVIKTPDDVTQPIYTLIDSKHTGHVDTILVDPKREGYPQYAFYDTTGSGKPDLVGYFHNHEFKPYSVEQYKEK
jgi:S1-C subfamily serine protease